MVQLILAKYFKGLHVRFVWGATLFVWVLKSLPLPEKSVSLAGKGIEKECETDQSKQNRHGCKL